MRWIAFSLGLAILVATAVSIVNTVVVPRGVSSVLSTAVLGLVRRSFFGMTRLVRSYEKKDLVLALRGPVTVLTLLVVWLVLVLAGFGLVLFPLMPKQTLGDSLRLAGSSIFTLGSVPEHGPGPWGVVFAAAATGLVVIALQIAYLPTLYGAFSRRETLVTMLESRAGAPAWGPEVLARHQLVGIVDNLAAFYADWERWAADLAESHTTYPVLIGFRSPQPLRSWVLGLLAVLDSAALYLALCPKAAPSQARLCLRMGFTAFRDIARTTNIAFDPDPLPGAEIELGYEDYLEGVARLEQAGFSLERSPEEAWPHFRGWRVNYESIAYRLADDMLAAPALWSGPRRHLRRAALAPQRPADRRPDKPAG